MSLNIKNDRVHDLAREAARVTGGTLTSAIEEALVLLLRERGVDPDQADRERRLARIMEFSAQFLAAPVATTAPREIADLYDESTGLPR
ncbi:hypothetical protein EK0264_07160 [Epidermidibacterium keratini]|uniref:Type II toxin-antitoxin system VapB family antitoxin n=1 Tax=Epidermidibacterium keratini TaxID=1891644 RepID=A0A7L4YLK3_9ACTN|nr:type II toxin-antitoxin system VapB family antitoxin [Epidermidibacterium keratini]QHC00076.1 hypothetical protein EK0264_07160 [Epidermidibacterium keratini]